MLRQKKQTIDYIITSIFPYGDPNLSGKLNTNILYSTTEYILSTKRFESSLFTEAFVT